MDFFFQGSEAVSAASTARATSSVRPAGTRSIISPDAGFLTSVHLSSNDAVSAPPILISMALILFAAITPRVKQYKDIHAYKFPGRGRNVSHEMIDLFRGLRQDSVKKNL
jgi:hypothetical protein